MDDLNKTIFKDKKLSDILEEIYNNQNKKSTQISALIKELQPLIENIGDATLVVPLIKDYLEVGVKNDDLLVKMAVLAQKSVSMGGDKDNPFGISQQEKEALLKEAKELNKKSLKK